MKKCEIVDKWIDALENGNYIQGKSVLKENGRFCCLGVLCDIIDSSGWKKEPSDSFERFRGTNYITPPVLVRDLIEMNNDEVHTLIEMNDYESKNFKEIAQKVRELSNANSKVAN